jgi:hypothetical protein
MGVERYVVEAVVRDGRNHREVAVPQRRPDAGAFACLACNQRRYRGCR